MSQRITIDDLRRQVAPLGRAVRVFEALAEPHRLRVGGPRVLHRPTGLRFCWVPDADDAPGFLLAEDVVTWADADALGVDLRAHRRVTVADSDDDAMPLYLGPDEIAPALGPLTLPSARAWERAYRAGARTRFPWGDAAPTAPPAWPHPLGLVRAAWYDELVADHTLRGGAACTWP